jgi:hypothetical protein
MINYGTLVQDAWGDVYLIPDGIKDLTDFFVSVTEMEESDNAETLQDRSAYFEKMYGKYRLVGNIDALLEVVKDVK